MGMVFLQNYKRKGGLHQSIHIRANPFLHSQFLISYDCTCILHTLLLIVPLAIMTLLSTAPPPLLGPPPSSPLPQKG